MSMLDDLKSAQQSPVSVYHQFLLKNTNFAECVHIFVEGHDDLSFYTGFVRRFLPHPNRLHTYKCHNKLGVYETHTKVMKVISSKNIALFFVDKDFSDILNENYSSAPNIYITDYYSIENYLVTDEIFERILNEVYHFPDIMLDTLKIQEKFQTELEHFYNLMLPITAWIIWARRNSQKPNLRNLDLSKMFILNDDLVLEKTDMCKQSGEITYLERMCQVATPPGWQDNVTLIINELSTLPKKKFIRGKFEVWFLVKFLSKLTMLLREALSENRETVKIRTPIGEGNIVAVLGPRIQMPTSVEKFLQEHLKEHKENFAE